MQDVWEAALMAVPADAHGPVRADADMTDQRQHAPYCPKSQPLPVDGGGSSWLCQCTAEAGPIPEQDADRLNEIREKAESREISGTASDGTEIVFCDDYEGEYVGWTTREIADAKGYTVSRTEPNRDVLDLLAALDAAEQQAAEKDKP